MNIILSGFTASGKTTLANYLAQKLNYKFIDLDAYISSKTNKAIAEIFETEGESGFRIIESKYIKEISALNDCVISVGGGTILNSTNVKNLKKNGVIVFLDVSVETVIRRVSSSNFISNDNLSEQENAIKQLLSGRLPIYKAVSDFAIDANSDNLEEKASKIIEGLNLTAKE